MRLFEERLIMLGIPYRVIGGPRFFERAEIRDALAYLRLIRSPDDDLAFERAVNQPKRGIGAASLQKLQAFARDDGRSLFTLTPMVLQTDEIKGPAKRGLTTFIDQINLWRDRLSGGMPHHELAQVILDESGYTDMLQKDRSPQSQTKIDNLKELIHALGQFDSLPAFLEHIELVMDVGGQSTGNEVQILTLHAAKGLEWPMVFLPGFKGTLEDLGERSSYNSPGWRRLQENAARSGKSSPIIEGKAENITSTTKPSAFRIGQRVHHEKFGYGQVLAADGTKLQVNFKTAGLKKVISTFVTGV